jgi:hypothetical protein
VKQLLLEVLLYPLSNKGVLVLSIHAVRFNAMEVLMLHMGMVFRSLQTEVAAVLLGLPDKGMTLVDVNLWFLQCSLRYISDKALVQLWLYSC